MRIGFLVVLLAGAVFYSYVAFADLNFMTRTGRLGPGFFPRMIGGMAIVALIWVILDEMRSSTPQYEDDTRWSDVLVLMVLAVGYAVLLRLFGGFVATVIFLLVALALLNRGRHITNVAVSFLVPTGVYLLFDQLLNAGMPPGLFEIL